MKIRPDTRVPDSLSKLHYLDLSKGKLRSNQLTFIRSINELVSRPVSTLPPIMLTPVDRPQTSPQERRNLIAEYLPQIVVGLIVAVVGGIILAVIIQADRFAPGPTPTLDAIPGVPTSTSALIPTPTTSMPTPTVIPTSTPTLSPEQLALTPVARNAEWTPVERDFDGVTMMLVPAGCFTIGANPQQDDEQNGNEVCFDAPFWIDKTEVTQADFSRLDGTQATAPRFTGDNRPVENITWFEARDYCVSRGGRLPSEAEWEYAARGPDELDYPWGDNFVGDNVVYSANSGNETANVGSRPGGESWVGALDMSGNVWEWTNSLYEPYPYAAADGREANTGNRRDVLRVLRGGSWIINSTDNLRAPYRFGDNPSIRSFNFGFRCAFSMNSSGN